MEAPEETGMEQVMSDLQALKRLYGLLHRGPADENVRILLRLHCYSCENKSKIDLVFQ